jgi:hypothetical protein
MSLRNSIVMRSKFDNPALIARVNCDQIATLFIKAGIVSRNVADMPQAICEKSRPPRPFLSTKTVEKDQSFIGGGGGSLRSDTGAVGPGL